MPDIRIHRDHHLGLAQARKVAWKWAEQDDVPLARMLAAGEAYDMVTARTGASRRTLQYWAKAAGLPPRSSGVPRVSARARVLAARLYGAGVPMCQCCASTGLSPQAVRSAALKAGHSLRPRARVPKWTYAQVVDTWQRMGRRTRDAADVLGLSVSSVQRNACRWYAEQRRAGR